MSTTTSSSSPNRYPRERRRWPRHEVEWPVTMSIEEGVPVRATARDASLHGLLVTGLDPVASSTIREGTRCHVEVHLAGGQARFIRVGEVRHVGKHGVGLLIAKALPLNVQLRNTPSQTTTVTNQPRHMPSVVSMLRSAVLAALYR